MNLRFILVLLFSLLIVLFTVQNANSVTIKFLFTEFSISQSLVILISITFGAVMAMLLGLIKQMKQKLKSKDTLKDKEKSEETR